MKILRFVLALAALVAFVTLSNVAVAQFGYLGLWAHGFKDVGSTQITTDLMIASVFALLWLIPDARARQIPWWPFVAVVVPAGSVGLLGYLVVREGKALRSAEESSPA